MSKDRRQYNREIFGYKNSKGNSRKRELNRLYKKIEREILAELQIKAEN